MPFLKNYTELNEYIAEHQGQQVVVRIRRKDEISKLAGRFEILRAHLPRYRRGLDALGAFIELCESEPMVMSDLHTGMDAAMLSVHLAETQAWLWNETERLSDLARSLVTSEDSWVDEIDEDNSDNKNLYIMAVTMDKVEKFKFPDVSGYMPDYCEELPTPKGSEDKLGSIAKGEEFGVFRTFTPKCVDRLKVVRARYEGLMNYANELVAALVDEGLSNVKYY